MKVKKFILCFLLSILLLPHISYGAKVDSKVYFIVINKLTLEDIKLMNNLNKIINNGSIGLMNTRGTIGYTGAESFLTINSSRKANANYNSIDFHATNPNSIIINSGLSKLINLNKDNNYLPQIGAIGDNLHKIGLKTAIYGNSDLIDIKYRSSALIPMDSKGMIDYGNIDNITIQEENYPFGIKTDYEKILIEIIKSPADFIVADTGDLERIFRYGDNLSDKDFAHIRNRILLDIDKFIGNLTKSLNHDNSLLIITSPNSGEPKVNDNKLAPIILWGNGVTKGTLSSSTTNKENIVTNLDIGPTILKFLGGPLDNMSGSPIVTTEKNISLDDITIQSKQINTTSKVRYYSLYNYGIISIIILSLPIILRIFNIKINEKIKIIIKKLLTILLIIPSIFLIVSIFKPKEVYTYLLMLLVLGLTTINLVWKIKNINNILLPLSAFSVFIILLDLVMKESISRYSVLSHDPIIGARYYGIGNEMVGLLLGSVTVLAIKILEKNNKSLLPLLLFIISVVFIAHPNYGANVGGTMAFIIAIISYILELLNKEFTINRVLIILVSIIALISIMGYIDIKLNKNTTHLGSTILLIKNDGLSYLNKTVIRKILMNIKLVGKSFWTYILLFLMAFNVLIIDLFIEKDNKALMASIVGITGAMVGFLVNDSGIILAAIAMNLITTGIYLEHI